MSAVENPDYVDNGPCRGGQADEALAKAVYN